MTQTLSMLAVGLFMRLVLIFGTLTIRQQRTFESVAVPVAWLVLLSLRIGNQPI